MPPNRSRTDHNLDLTALLRFTPDAQQTYEAGFARKTRSPNLYERYAWSTNNTMTMTMINWFGDGNGYVGNLDLKPEVANTISATASWHDAAREQWGFNITPYYTYVQDYIDARRCSGGSDDVALRSQQRDGARQASSTSSSSINPPAFTAPTFPATSRCSRAVPSAR
jgi:iron complex outermembrane receptor protein